MDGAQLECNMVSKKYKAIIFMISIAFLTCAAHADQSSQKNSKNLKNKNGEGTIANKLSQLSKRQALLKSKLKIKHLESKIHSAGKKKRNNATTTHSMSNYTGATLPVISAIIGVQKHYKAILLYPNGVFTAHRGEVLPGGIKIQSISQRNVVVTTPKGRKTTLMFAGQGGASQLKSSHSHSSTPSNQQRLNKKSARLSPKEKKTKDHGSSRRPKQLKLMRKKLKKKVRENGRSQKSHHFKFHNGPSK